MSGAPVAPTLGGVGGTSAPLGVFVTALTMA
jgi:hypothetical protein